MAGRSLLSTTCCYCWKAVRMDSDLLCQEPKIRVASWHTDWLREGGGEMTDPVGDTCTRPLLAQLACLPLSCKDHAHLAWLGSLWHVWLNVKLSPSLTCLELASRRGLILSPMPVQSLNPCPANHSITGSGLAFLAASTLWHTSEVFWNHLCSTGTSWGATLQT